jgi:hypothetical protein
LESQALAANSNRHSVSALVGGLAVLDAAPVLKISHAKFSIQKLATSDQIVHAQRNRGLAAELDFLIERTRPPRSPAKNASTSLRDRLTVLNTFLHHKSLKSLDLLSKQIGS